MSSESDHLRRLAMQIAAQLPEGEREALYVLETAADLVRHLAATPEIRPSQPSFGRRRSLEVVQGGAAAGPTALLDTTNPSLRPS